MFEANSRSKDLLVFVRNFKPKRLLQISLTATNVLLSFFVAFSLSQDLQPHVSCQAAAFLSLAFFMLTVTFILFANELFGEPTGTLDQVLEKKHVRDHFAADNDVDNLQQELEFWLYLGDAEKADQLSRELLSVSTNFPSIRWSS